MYYFILFLPQPIKHILSSFTDEKTALPNQVECQARGSPVEPCRVSISAECSGLSSMEFKLLYPEYSRKPNEEIHTDSSIENGLKGGHTTWMEISEGVNAIIQCKDEGGSEIRE